MIWKLNKISLIIILFIILITGSSISCSEKQHKKCQSVENCNTNEICLNGICRQKTECIWSSDCAKNEVCTNGSCVKKDQAIPECVKNNECQNGFICEDGRCIKHCSRNSDCLSEEVCKNNSCILKNAPCTNNSNCSKGFMCINNVCQNVTLTSECTSNADCNAGQICRNNECWLSKPECSKNEDCLSGQVCLKGRCQTPKEKCGEQCEFGKKRCQGYKIQFCEKQKTGCRSWGNLRDCINNNICDNDVCVAVTRKCNKSTDCPSGKACYLLEDKTIDCKVIETPPIDAKCKIKIEKAILFYSDDDNSLPDSYIVVIINGIKYRTETKINTDKPIWNTVLTKEHSFNDIVYSMIIYLMDENSTKDEIVGVKTPNINVWKKTSAKGEKSIEWNFGYGKIYFSVNCVF